MGEQRRPYRERAAGARLHRNAGLVLVVVGLYLDDELADAIVAAGFERVRMRSYQAGTTGGGSVRIIEVDDPEGLLSDMSHTSEGVAKPYPDLPEGRMSRGVLQVESTRAHDVFFHFRTIMFLSDPYVVQVQMHATSAEAAQRRASTTRRPSTNCSKPCPSGEPCLPASAGAPQCSRPSCRPISTAACHRIVRRAREHR